MKKTIFLATLVAAFAATATAQNRDGRYENRKEYNSNDDHYRRNDNDKNRRYDDRRDGNIKSNHGEHSRNNNYNRNYGNNGAGNYGNNRRYGIDERYNQNWNFDYAPENWKRDAKMKINDGQRRGLITRMESRRLFNELQRVERCEIAYSRNGYFSRRERMKLIDDIRDLNKEIYHQTSDDDRSWFNSRNY